MGSAVTPVAELPAPLLGLLAMAVRSAPRGGTIRLHLQDGDRDGHVQVRVEEARHHLGLDSTWTPPAADAAASR